MSVLLSAMVLVCIVDRESVGADIGDSVGAAGGDGVSAVDGDGVGATIVMVSMLLLVTATLGMASAMLARGESSVVPPWAARAVEGGPRYRTLLR